jgi:hypothetical protein
VYKFSHPSSLSFFDENLTALKGGELNPKRLKIMDLFNNPVGY